MYIGGTDTKGLPPPALGDRRQLRRRGDQRLRHAHRRDAAQGRQVASRSSDNGRGIPVDIKKKHKKSALELMFTTLHAGGKFSSGAATSSRAACTASARRWSTRCRRSWSAEVRRDGAALGAAVRARQAGSASSGRSGPARGTGTTITFRPTRRSSASRASIVRDHSRAAGGQDVPAQGPGDRLHRRGGRHEARVRARRAASPTSSPRSSPIAARRPRAPQTSSTSTSGTTTALRIEVGAAVDRGHRRDDPLVRQRHPHHARRHPRAGLPSRPSSRRCAASSTTHDLDAQGRRAHRRGHPRGDRRRAVDLRARAAVPGADQGAARTTPRLQAQVEARCGPALENFLLENKTAGDAIVERIVLAARAREASRAAAQAVSRKTAISHRLNLPGKLADCDVDRPGQERAVHRRGRLRRRLGQAGARPRDPGDPAAAGQGAERRAGALQKVLANKELQDVVSALGCGMGDRVQRRAAPLRQGHPADGRRHRRPPHRHLAADLLLPPPAPAHRRRARLPGAAAALPDRLRQGDATGRSTTPTATGSWRRCPKNAQARTSPGSRASARCRPSSSRRPRSTRDAPAPARDRRRRSPRPTASSPSSWARTSRPASSSSWTAPRSPTSTSKPVIGLGTLGLSQPPSITARPWTGPASQDRAPSARMCRSAADAGLILRWDRRFVEPAL